MLLILTFLLLWVPAAVLVWVVIEERRACTRLISSLPVEWLVVFGAHVTSEGPCLELASRLDRAIVLWSNGIGRQIIVSGGYSGAINETTIMADYLLSRGIPYGDILCLVPGHSTLATVRSMLEHRQRSWLSVSSGYHAARIRLVARFYGFSIDVAAPFYLSSGGFYLWRQRFREVVAMLCFVFSNIRG